MPRTSWPSRGIPPDWRCPRLVALLTRLKRADDLTALKANSTNAASTIDRISLGQTLGSGDKEQAEALLARLIEAEPDSLEYRADLARVLRDLGRPEQAEETLRDLVDRRPERPQTWLALLALQLERGDRTAASATIERLKKEYKGERPDFLLIRCLWAVGSREEAARSASGNSRSVPTTWRCSNWPPRSRKSTAKLTGPRPSSPGPGRSTRPCPGRGGGWP